ncbi:superoxide dismutase [Cu-Zn] SodC [Halopseudomonas sp.]|uniref:superoxide dismutase [Cu-Zn] SodC n=1 Tax=Halopseudomonas sp. TaxID=2901191 RepID=UPI00356B3DB6
MKSIHWLAIAGSLAIGSVHAAETQVTMHLVDDDGAGQSIGQVTVQETAHGLLFTPDLKQLDAGFHGFHVHQHGSCEPKEKDGSMTAAAAAGGHLDPNGAGSHKGPYEQGHLGDLPALYVNVDGEAEVPVLAPRLERLQQIDGKALIIHAQGDNYSDDPKPLGGGGARVACGVI